MNPIAQTIKAIQTKEKLTFEEVLKKYPHLAQLLGEELQELQVEKTDLKEGRKLLLD